MPAIKQEKARGPKTELDEKFLSIARQIMKSHGINSDRAISLALGRKPDFINRVSNGVQSATPEAWDALFSKYPEARGITTTNVMAQGGGQAVGINHGTATQHNYSADQERLNDNNGVDAILLTDTQLLIIELKSHNEQLKSQLADKERIIKLLEQSLNK